MTNLLSSINSPEDLRKLPKDKLPQLAREIRDLIIGTVSESGGHLGAGLGATDLAVVLHYVLDTPRDALIWDIGHQVQAHKILTGRREAFRKSFRKYKGISGLVNKDESPFDLFTTGHGGTAISSALGVTVSRRLLKQPGKVVAVIGDASIASGMAFEALNHAGHLDENLIVILNDNEMSISPSVGALSKYLNKVISNPLYNRIRSRAEKIITSVPKVGPGMIHTAKQIEEGIKHLLVPGLIFEALGFRYFGPIDGHDVLQMAELFPNIFGIKGPLLVHVVTRKGKGYEIAENNPERWHASAPFHVETGDLKKKSAEATYTQVFGRKIVELARSEPRLTALTGGMTEGTGLTEFSRRFPERFFDIGISEEHGVTFCAGLAHGGLRPVAAIYSTFLQRSHDQIIHDVALQNLPVMFCLDRAGLVGEDGPTHHGAFDITYLRKVPNLAVLAPRDGTELEQMLEFMVAYTRGPIAVRYPRGAVQETQFPALKDLARQPIELGRSEILREGADVCFLALGSMVGPCLEASDILSREEIQSTVVNARFAKPLDEPLIHNMAARHRILVTVEEGTLRGGFGAGVMEWLAEAGAIPAHTASAGRHESPPARVVLLGLPDRFIEAGPRNVLLENVGLSPEKIADVARQSLRATEGSEAIYEHRLLRRPDGLLAMTGEGSPSVSSQ